MKKLSYIILILFTFCLNAQASTISVIEKYWEIHKNNGEVIRIPYAYLDQLSFSKVDADGVEHGDFVSQSLVTHFPYTDIVDAIDDIAFMQYVQTIHNIEAYDQAGEDSPFEVISSKGVDWTFNFPAGTSVSSQQDWLEIEEDDHVKVKVNRNNTAFWRSDILRVSYPNGETAYIPIEQPGDTYFRVIEASAGLSVDFKNISSDSEVPSITYGLGIGGYTSGSKNCEFIGQVGAKIHRYVLRHEDKEDNGSHRTIYVDVTLDVSREPGQVLRSSITDNQHWVNGATTSDINFSASFGVTEDNYDFHMYSTTQLPTTWSYSYHSHDSDTGRSETGTIVGNIILSAGFSVSFLY